IAVPTVATAFTSSLWRRAPSAGAGDAFATAEVARADGGAGACPPGGGLSPPEDQAGWKSGAGSATGRSGTCRGGRGDGTDGGRQPGLCLARCAALGRGLA